MAIVASKSGNIDESTATADAIVHSSDVLTKQERLQYGDECAAALSDGNDGGGGDGVMVTIRDPESAHPVRVATMEFVVPDKLPQPRNYLESLVWERESEVNVLRDRFQLARALSQAKTAAAQLPRRDLFKYIRDAQAKLKVLF